MPTINFTMAKQLISKIRSMTGSKDLAETIQAILAGNVTGWRDVRTIQLFNQPAPATATATATLTAAQLLTGLIQATPAAAASYTLPLASALETALLALYPELAVDDAFDFTIVNLSTTAANDITVVTNTGWTTSGELVIEADEATQLLGSEGTFRVRRTAANTYTLYRVG